MNILALAGINVPGTCYLWLVLLYLAVTIGMSFRIRSGFHMKAYWHGDRTEKKIALTFDDGPERKPTAAVLDVLKAENVQATFFCIGHKLNGSEELVRRIHDEGHLLGSHSFSHSDWFDLFMPGQMRREFDQTNILFEGIIQKHTRFFRPPYGVINPMLRKALKKTGYFVIGFSNRAYDTSTRKKEKILRRLEKNLKPGDIILLHDTMSSTPDVLREFIPYVREKGYSIVPLDQLLNLPAYE
jgi:peptidoglycan/xylan/chitin deacetylase (PgdA/CDA1 family)